MRCATLVLGLAATLLVACTDLRGFEGSWDGTRVGDVAVLRVGPGEHASLAIDGIDAHGMQGRIAIPGLVPETAFESLAGAEADALANLSFGGSPLRVYLAFVPIPDGGGDAFLVIALYDDRRIEIRVLRGGPAPLYAIFAMVEATGAAARVR